MSQDTLWREGESKQQPSMDPTTSVKASPSSVEEVYVSCHDIEASNVTIRLYYPTEKQKVPVSQASWLPKCWFYLWGYYDCTSIPKFLLPFVYPFALNVKIESGQDQTLLPPPPSASSSSPPSKRSYPLLIFSHGLCGMRTTYSKYCIDMARQGFIVAALEHADKSASVAQRNNYNEYVRFHRPNAKLEKRPSQTDDEYLREFRSSQLEIRKREVFETLSILKDLDSGTSIENKLGKNEMQNALVQASFKGCIDWEKLVVSGHSFGGR